MEKKRFAGMARSIILKGIQLYSQTCEIFFQRRICSRWLDLDISNGKRLGKSGHWSKHAPILECIIDKFIGIFGIASGRLEEQKLNFITGALPIGGLREKKNLFKATFFLWVTAPGMLTR